MSFDDIASRLKKHSGAKEKPDRVRKDPPDIHEVYALRARMLGVLIRDARVASGYTVEDIAGWLEVSAEIVVNWEFGREVPSLPQIELLAYYLEVPISHFWSTETLQQQRASRYLNQDEYLALRNRMVGALLHEARENKGLDAAALAEKVGVSPEDIQAYEAGQTAVPMTVMVSLSSVLEVNLNYFLDDDSRVGEFFEVQEVVKLVAEMSPELRAFLATPANHPYIKVAISLSQMPTDALRELASSLLDITL